MNKKPAKASEAERRRIMAFVTALSKLFGVHNHEVSVRYQEEDLEEYAACIEYDEEYRRIHIKIYPCFFEDNSVSQASYLMHEFCHIFTIPFIEAIKGLHSGERFRTWKEVKELSERQTTAIEQMLSFFISGNAPYTRKAYQEFIKKRKRKP